MRAETLPEKSSKGISPRVTLKGMLIKSLSIAKKDSDVSINHPSVSKTIDPALLVDPSEVSVIKLDKSSEENLIVKIYLLPDKRIQGQAKCKRGLPDPVFAERFIFQVPYIALNSLYLN